MTHYPNDNNSVDLSGFDDDFASAAAPSHDEVPDGKYQVRIQSVRLDRTRQGDPMIRWDLIVISGSHAGRHIFKNSVITPTALPYIKGDLETLGMKLAKLSDLTNHLEDLLDVTAEVTKRTRGEFSNVYFNKRIQIAGGGVGTSFSDDDSVPF